METVMQKPMSTEPDIPAEPQDRQQQPVTAKSTPKGAILAFIIPVGLLTLGIIIWYCVGEGPQRTTSSSTFCCPEVVEQLSRTVNRSLNPCENFYAYVCSRVIGSNISKYGRDVQYLFAPGVTQGLKSATSIPAGGALSRYYRSCLAVESEPALYEQFTDAFIRACNVRLTMNAADIAKFFFAALCTYRIPSLVHMRFYGNDSRMYVSTIMSQRSVWMCGECDTAFINAFNRNLESNLTLHNVKDFESAALRNMSNNNITGDLSTVREIFSETSDASWRGFVEDLRIMYPGENLTSIKIDVEREDISNLLRLIVDPDNQPASIAYTLLVSVYIATWQYALPDVFYGKAQRVTRCWDIIKDAAAMWDVLYTQGLTNRSMDEHFRHMYGQVQQVVVQWAITSGMFPLKDRETLKSVINGVRLILPSQFAVIDVPLPNITRLYGENFLRYREYAYLVGRVKRSRDIPEYNMTFSLTPMIGPTRMLTPMGFYRWCVFNHPRSFFLNMAVFGIRAAQMLWYATLGMHIRKFSVEFRANVSSVRECIEKKYPGLRKYATFLQALTLAARSVQPLVIGSQWNTDVYAWGIWKLSLGKVFYMRYADTYCTLYSSEILSAVLNIHVRETQNFASTFQCSPDSYMFPNDTCLH